MTAQIHPVPAESVLSPTKEAEYRERIARKLRERGFPEEKIPAQVDDLLHRRLPIDFRAAGLFD